MQLLISGYHLGIGNQSIQIPFLKRLIDPSLYTRDAMVNETIARYPTWFFRMLAAVSPGTQVDGVYLALHLVVTIAVMAAAFALSWSLLRNRWAALAFGILLVAGHHRALAGELLYSPGFTHAWAVFPFAVLALALGLAGRWLPAFALCGALVNFHALTAAYAGALITACAVVELIVDQDRRALLRRLVPAVLAAMLLAAPTVPMLFFHGQSHDAEWFRLMHIRSAEHSFPTSWWRSGNADLSQYAALLGLAAVACGFAIPMPQRRRLFAACAGAAVLGAVGWIGTDLFHSSLVVRAQLWRCSALVLMLALVLIAHGCCAAWRQVFEPASLQGRALRCAEGGTALVVALTVAIPALSSFAPLALGLAAGMALVRGRLSWAQAAIVGCAALVIFCAWRWLGVGTMAATFATGVSQRMPGVALRSIVIAVALAAIAFLLAQCAWAQRSRWSRWTMHASMAFGVALLAIMVARTVRDQGANGDDWIAVQRWAKATTPVDALFLTPAFPGGFRIRSERAVVGEWRDGTQLYFDAGFSADWWRRMEDLNPEMLFDDTGKRRLAAGRAMGDLDDADIVALCRRYGAAYAVVPSSAERQLSKLYANASWAVYAPVFPAPTVAPPSPGDGASDQRNRRDEQRFMADVVRPNIEKYRKSAVAIQVVDAAGLPLYDLPYDISQTRSSFAFSCSLPFFVPPANRREGGFSIPTVTEAEKQRFLELFNCSMMSYSGKWLYIEPEPDHYFYDDLDAYVAWCRDHAVDMEYHFVSGYLPAWVKMLPQAEKEQRFLAHARDLAARYGKDIRYWQVVNETILIHESPPVFAELRRLLPGAKLGISDCARFYSAETDPAAKERDLLRGINEVRWLKKNGVTIDFFAIHGHRPFGVWVDARDIYHTIDAFAAEGVKLQISEFGVHDPHPIIGSLRRGTWNDALQAEYYRDYYTACFSHPAVEMINLFGMDPYTWISGGGLLDQSWQPKAAFTALKQLITEEWRTHAVGRTAADGFVRLRGFHGTYQLRLGPPGAVAATIIFAVEPGSEPHLRVRFDGKTGTATLLSPAAKP